MKKRLLFIILGLGILVRLVYFFQINGHFLFNTPILDAKYYSDWAVEISKGDWSGSGRGVFMMSPGYSYFIAIIYKIFGVSVAAVVLAQFMLGILTGYMIYLIGKKHFSETAGYIGMGFYLLYAAGIFYESTLLKSTLINFLNVAAVYAVTGKLKPWKALVSGALIGISFHMRPNVIIIAPLIAVWLWHLKEDKYRNIAGLAAGFILMLAPVALRNYIVGGEFALSTAHGGMNFYTGNSAFCLGPYTPLPFARTDPEVEQDDFLAEARRLSGKNLTRAQSSSFWYGEAARYIFSHPFKWLNLTFRKALIFINSYEPPINLDYYFFLKEYKSVLSLPLFGYGLILPLAVIGIIYFQGRILFTGYLAVYALMGIFIFVVSEYRFPVVPFLCLYAGKGTEQLAYFLNKGAAKKAAVAASLLAALLIAVNCDIYSGLFGFNLYKRANLANSYFGLGVTYYDNGMAEKAAEAYGKSISIMPQTPALINLAGIYEEKNDLDSARKLYSEAIRLNPHSPEAFNNMGSILFKQKDYEGAYNCFMRALELNPSFAEARSNLDIAGRYYRGAGKK